MFASSAAVGSGLTSAKGGNHCFQLFLLDVLYMILEMISSPLHIRLGVSLSFAVLLAGCGGLQDVWESQDAKVFRPRVIAVLPPMASEYDIAREDVQEVLADALHRSYEVERVLSPESVTHVFQTSKAAFDALVTYISRLEMTGHSDRDSAVMLGKLLSVDSFLVVRVNSWEYARGVGLSLRLVDATTGATIWKGRHERSASYMIFKPNLRDVAKKLADEMIKYMPPHPRR